MQSKKILVAVALLYTLLGCEAGKDARVPDDLTGIWRTSEPKYANRFFSLTTESITFGIGEGRVNAYAIRSVKKALDNQAILYTIVYVDDAGQEYKLSLLYDPAIPGVVRFKNQQQIAWKKKTR